MLLLGYLGWHLLLTIATLISLLRSHLLQATSGLLFLQIILPLLVGTLLDGLQVLLFVLLCGLQSPLTLKVRPDSFILVVFAFLLLILLAPVTVLALLLGLLHGDLPLLLQPLHEDLELVLIFFLDVERASSFQKVVEICEFVAVSPT